MIEDEDQGEGTKEKEDPRHIEKTFGVYKANGSYEEENALRGIKEDRRS